MRYWKRAGALLAAGALLLGLTACGSSITDDATVYVQGLLDANYKGEISQDYIDVVEDMTRSRPRPTTRTTWKLRPAICCPSWRWNSPQTQ